MKVFRRSCRNMFAAAALATAIMASAPANSGVIQLGFILDSSGSIGSGNWNTIRTGLASAINTLVPVGGTDTYEITVVSFSTNAVTTVAPTLLTAASKPGVVAAIQNAAFQGGTTDYTAAFGLMDGLLFPGGQSSAASTYLNFATDGDPNPDSANGLTQVQHAARSWPG